MKEVGVINEVIPCGNYILLELLTPQEMMGTDLYVPEGKKERIVASQGYVVSVGPQVNLEQWGFKIGDRVFISGNVVEAPKVSKKERIKLTLLPDHIRGVLKED